MYRLLIVTEKQSVRDMFEGMSGWEVMGFKQPRLRATTEEAIACMEKHHIDAIAMDPGEAFADLNAHVEQNCPTMLRFEVEENPEEQLKTIRLLDRLLNQIRADHSNDLYDENNALQYTRDRQLKAVLSGLVPTRKELNARLRCATSLAASSLICWFMWRLCLRMRYGCCAIPVRRRRWKKALCVPSLRKWRSRWKTTWVFG